MAAVAKRFGLPEQEPASVKRADNGILADEAAQIMGDAPKDWYLPEAPLGAHIVGLSPSQAKSAFLLRYQEIVGVEVAA